MYTHTYARINDYTYFLDMHNVYTARRRWAFRVATLKDRDPERRLLLALLINNC